MSLDADVIIVGGGPAGLTTALYLAACAPELVDRVLILERGTYPRDKPCAGGVGGRADRVLARIGVRVDVPSAHVRGVAVSVRGGRVTRRERAGLVVGRVVERAIFDARLAEIALARGARIAQGVRVERVEPGADHVTVHTDHGEIRARFVVGADGVGSIVRRAVPSDVRALRAQVVEVDTQPVSTDVDRDILHFDASDASLDGYVWDFPAPREKDNVCRGAYVLKIPGRKSPDAARVLDQHLQRLGLDPARYPQKRFAERAFSSRAPLTGPRLMLVGEAAGVDPVSGEGIAQAIGYGALAGPFLAERLRARDAHLDGWSRRLNRSALGIDLHGRAQLTRFFFGPRRAFYEQALLRVPEALDVGLRYFGGLSPDAGQTARVAASGLRLEAGALVRRVGARAAGRVSGIRFQDEEIGLARARE